MGEGLVRLVGHVDEDGQFWFGEQRVRPYRIPTAKIADLLGKLSVADLHRVDPDLGWTNGPKVENGDGTVSTDSVGARGRGERSAAPADGVLRIAVFGDSFTFGDEVATGETWAARLEDLLEKSGQRAEVLNFGVNAYGMDQALLRWEKEGRPLKPAIVILGFQPENLLRNLNVLRPLYFMDTAVPYSKPRFVLDGDALRNVNHPTVPAAELPAVLAHPADSPLAEHDRFLSGGHRERWWHRSRLAALLAELFDDGGDVPGFAVSPEMSEVGLRIVREFARTARESGAAFLVVHLPRREELADLEAGREPWDLAFLDALATEVEVVRPERDFGPIGDGDIRPRGHYGPRLHQKVADALLGPVRRAAPRASPAFTQ
jgi:hypothetical protein